MKIIWIAVALLVFEPVAAQVLINQVYPDPVGNERGGEFVELINKGNSNIDISGWIIATKSSANDAIIPNETILGLREHYLVADAGWSQSKDNPGWPPADLEDAITLTNDAGWVALVSPDGIEDRVQWGNGSELNAEPGLAFTRVGDSYITAEPFTAEDAKELNVEAENSSSESFIVTVTPDAEPRKAGIQIRLDAGKPTEVNIQAITDADNVYAELGNRRVEFLSVNGSWEGHAAVAFDTPPGIVTLTVHADDRVKELNLTILPTVGVKMDAATLNFGQVRAGQNATINGDLDIDSGPPTLQNTGNVPIVVRFAGKVEGAGLSYVIKGKSEDVSRKPGPSEIILPGELVGVDFALIVPRTARSAIRAKINLLATSGS